MNFHFDKIILWLKNDETRYVTFLPNKVNVIIGDSSTGKTDILDIIDYCFFASEAKISESIINENVKWYGLQFKVNGKPFTVARKAIRKNKVSDEYYFSSSDELPKRIFSNNSEAAIKSMLETEFNIDRNAKFPYGSNQIKPGSKISLRYFLMFNTISVNIIENDTGVFFDMQHKARYRDALPRIFDLAVGIETIENVLKKEKKLELEKTLKSLERKKELVSTKVNAFNQEQSEVVKKAKEHSLINKDLDLKSSLKELHNVISEIKSDNEYKQKNEQLEHEIYLKERKIKNLQRFSKEYNYYKKNLSLDTDSLKPIVFLKEKDSQIIKTSEFSNIIENLSSDLKKIRATCVQNTPIDRQVSDEIENLKKDLINLRSKLSITPKTYKNFEDNRSKYLFLGEIKAKMELYSSSNSTIQKTTEDDIRKIEKNIKSLKVFDNYEKRDLAVNLIEEIIADYMRDAGKALVNYADYKPVFNYKNKSLSWRKPKASYTENIGSSSNHMFMQLFFSLAMQEIAFQNESPFIAPYLIIDQPSRPYYGRGEEKKTHLEHSDESKITKAFELLNKFISTRIKNSGEFQIIVFEHVPKKVFKDLKNIHLVEEFYDGNALIPSDFLNRNS